MRCSHPFIHFINLFIKQIFFENVFQASVKQKNTETKEKQTALFTDAHHEVEETYGNPHGNNLFP
jgi:hypothetical protein